VGRDVRDDRRGHDPGLRLGTLRKDTLVGIELSKGEQPWNVPGPKGPTAVIAVVLEGDEATLDNGALHARSKPEVGVRFSQDPAAQGKGERLRLVWVASAAGSFVGAVAVDLWIDRATKTGFKRVNEHVNRMTAAVRGTFDLADLSATQKKSVAALLERVAADTWKGSSELQKALV
jgi:hypothetical protein